MKKIVVLTGAGVSKESGINTFRDAGGLWEGHNVMDVASPEGWARDQDLVLDFYNKRRQTLKEVKPNAAHLALVELEEKYNVVIITQNVDNLHEKAGSSNVLHLHGLLTKVRSTKNSALVYDWTDDLNTGDLCEDGHQLRPHIVWFGEDVPMIEKAVMEMRDADHVIIIGTSMQVYPAASLIHYAPDGIPASFIDPNPSIDGINFNVNLSVIPEKATVGVTQLVKELLK